MNRLERIAKLRDEIKTIFHDRRSKYGDAYLSHGSVMDSIFGTIELNNVNDYTRFGLLNSIVGKLNRYDFDIENDNANKDCMLDMANYCLMLAEYDDSILNEDK